MGRNFGTPYLLLPVEHPGIILLLAGLAVQGLSLPATLLRRAGLPSVCVIITFGLIVALTGTAVLLVFPLDSAMPAWIPVRISPLALWFTGVSQAAGLPISLYTYSYLKRVQESREHLGPFLAAYAVLQLTLQFIPLADHMILFLVLWELMVAAAFIGLLFEKGPHVRSGSLSYFFASHFSVLILFGFFLLVHKHTGSWLISAAFHSAFEQETVTALFFMGVTAFGIKAGVMPFHFWLPRAHPIAPTYLSAFLSGINVKVGIYGLFIVLQIVPRREAMGWFLLALGAVTAVGGVWYALAQHDLKRLLAYHTVENIGIILMGIGLGTIGAALDRPLAAALGFGGALLHVLNHALFKTLLFIGAGVIYQNTHTRNLEALGGLIRRSRTLALFFLIGSIAICGLPPLNGFVSEFLIFRGFFEASGGGHSAVALLMIIATVSLAFAGGLAVACFTKVNGIVFLGSPRRDHADFKLHWPETASLGLLVLACVLIGVFPAVLVPVWSRVLMEAGFLSVAADAGIADNVHIIGIASAVLIISAGALVASKIRFTAINGVRISDLWACGYRPVTARMQYTASSFADTLVGIAESPLGIRSQGGGPRRVLPENAAFHSHPTDFAELWIIGPLFRRALRGTRKVTRFFRNDIRLYVSMVLVTLTMYTVISVIWNMR